MPEGYARLRRPCEMIPQSLLVFKDILMMIIKILVQTLEEFSTKAETHNRINGYFMQINVYLFNLRKHNRNIHQTNPWLHQAERECFP